MISIEDTTFIESKSMTQLLIKLLSDGWEDITIYTSSAKILYLKKEVNNGFLNFYHDHLMYTETGNLDDSIDSVEVVMYNQISNIVVHYKK